jgi:transglutaminase-like putative cysteine protease
VLYDIRHVTTYAYSAPVPFARCVLRMFPREEPGQRVLSSALRLEPGASQQRDGQCFFGNRVMTVTIERQHRALTVAVRSRVEVLRADAPLLALAHPWESVRDAALRQTSLSPHDPSHHLYASRLVPMQPEATAYAAESFSPGRPLVDGARDLMARIRRDFVYDPKATVISTPIAEVLKARRGVCQDFAHVMIAGLRGLGLPAAYVSGYLRTIPPPGQKRLEGADATHAWVSVWCGPAEGWIGLDPTNDIVAGEDHIVVARGRDYADVAPIDGVLIGSGEQSLTVKVDVEPVSG